MTSSRPKSPTTRSTKACTCAASPTSSPTAIALPPRRTISLATASAASTWTSPRATVAPSSAARGRAVARPRRSAPPGIAATRSCSRIARIIAQQRRPPHAASLALPPPMSFPRLWAAAAATAHAREDNPGDSSPGPRLRRPRAVRGDRGVPRLLDGDHPLQARCGPLSPGRAAALVQPAAHARALRAALQEHLLQRPAPQHAAARGLRGGAHDGDGGSGRLRPRPPATARRGEPRDRHLPDVPGSAYHPLHPARPRGRCAGGLRLVVGAGGGLSRLHHPVLHVEDDGLLQDGAARDRGGGVAGRLQPAREPLAHRLAG